MNFQLAEEEKKSHILISDFEFLFSHILKASTLFLFRWKSRIFFQFVSRKPKIEMKNVKIIIRWIYWM